MPDFGVIIGKIGTADPYDFSTMFGLGGQVRSDSSGQSIVVEQSGVEPKWRVIRQVKSGQA